jgi:hypothetical protein
VQRKEPRGAFKKTTLTADMTSSGASRDSRALLTFIYRVGGSSFDFASDPIWKSKRGRISATPLPVKLFGDEIPPPARAILYFFHRGRGFRINTVFQNRNLPVSRKFVQLISWRPSSARVEVAKLPESDTYPAIVGAAAPMNNPLLAASSPPTDPRSLAG